MASADYDADVPDFFGGGASQQPSAQNFQQQPPQQGFQQQFPQQGFQQQPPQQGFQQQPPGQNFQQQPPQQDSQQQPAALEPQSPQQGFQQQEYGGYTGLGFSLEQRSEKAYVAMSIDAEDLATMPTSSDVAESVVAGSDADSARHGLFVQMGISFYYLDN